LSQVFAASIVAIPASRSSFGSRSCSVRNSRPDKKFIDQKADDQPFNVGKVKPKP
jgi:hypothetical protein